MVERRKKWEALIKNDKKIYAKKEDVTGGGGVKCELKIIEYK